MQNRIKNLINWIYIIIGFGIGCVVGYSAYILINSGGFTYSYFIFYGLILICLFVGIYFLQMGIKEEYNDVLDEYSALHVKSGKLIEECNALEAEINEMLSRYSTIDVDGGDLDD